MRFMIEGEAAGVAGPDAVICLARFMKEGEDAGVTAAGTTGATGAAAIAFFLELFLGGDRPEASGEDVAAASPENKFPIL